MRAFGAMVVFTGIFCMGAGGLPAREVFVSAAAPEGGTGTKGSPFASIQEAAPHLKPGDVVKLAAGVYYGSIAITDLGGTENAPITFVAADDGEVVLDGGQPWFAAKGNDEWEKVEDGAPDEWRSKREIEEPMTALMIEPGIRLLRYSNPNDFRALNELGGGLRAGLVEEIDARPGPSIIASRRDPHPLGARRAWTYFGPGVIWNSQTKRQHIRLSPTRLLPYVAPQQNSPFQAHNPGAMPSQVPQTSAADYDGPRDPREIAISAASLNGTLLTLRKCQHVVFRKLVFRNSGQQVMRLSGNTAIRFEDCVFHQERYFARFNNDSYISFLHCEFDGGLPPWSFRSEFKDSYFYVEPDGTIIENNLVRSTSRAMMGIGKLDHLEVAYCEFRNAHDLYLGGTNTRFHHNLIEDIHDDALFVSTPEIDNMHIYQNVMRRCLMGLAFHGNKKGGTRFIYRNLFDLREETRSFRPRSGRTHPQMVWRSLFIAKMGMPGPFSAYQNTFLVTNFETITGGHQYPDEQYPRQLFNNILVSLNAGVPIVVTMPPDYPAQRDGNIFFRAGDRHVADLLPGFATLDAYRASEDFVASKKWYAPGWEAQSLNIAPGFKKFSGASLSGDDLRLSEDSPARGVGVILPENLEDPLRPARGVRPDIGAFPFGSEPLRVGRHGRHSFPETTTP